MSGIDSRPRFSSNDVCVSRCLFGGHLLPLSWHLCLSAWLSVSCCVLALGGTVTSTDPDFSLTVPAGYIQITSPNAIYAFATSDPAAGKVPDATVAVQRLHGTIGPGHMDLSATGIPDAHFLRGKWKTFDIDIVAGHVTRNGIPFAMRGAQIPLQHEAIQILLLVPAEQDARADRIMQEFLAGLDGPSNWPSQPALSAEERGRLLGGGIVRLAITIGLLFAGAVALIRYFRRRKHARHVGKAGPR